MFVEHFFKLSDSVKEELHSMKPSFGYDGFSEFLFYRTYSRVKPNGQNETWADVVIRVTEGCFSIRKDHYLKNHLTWDEDFWQTYSYAFAKSMFAMQWLPAGRGLWSMGTNFVYERGAMALMNCAYLDITKDIGSCANWAMDSLMCGVGVGFGPIRDDELKVYVGDESKTLTVIPDSREGWCESVKLLIDSYLRPNIPHPVFDYSHIRPGGLPIKGFGGISSGPDPLIKLHDRIRMFFKMYDTLDWYDSVLLKTDILNCIAACVVAGNVRRSAQIAFGSLYDPTFVNLKNYKKYPHRAIWGGNSNNSVYLESKDDYDQLDKITEQIINTAEPGIFCSKNLKYGRIGRPEDNVKLDKGYAGNPCGEMILENRELCNLVETLPTKCDNYKEWLKAVEYATVYASTCTLLPTHRVETNSVMFKNRRIGVSITDVTGWIHKEGRNRVTKYLREGYKLVRSTNKWLADEAGIPESVRVTTIKPSGTVSKLAGVTSGCGYPTFRHTLRRVRIAANSPIVKLLVEANVPYEPDVVSDNTLVFSFPILQGPSKTGLEASLFEQAFNVIMLQREWSDNSVSNTLYFKPKWIKIQELDLDNLKELKVDIDPKIFDYQDLYQTKEYKVEVNREYNSLSVYKYDPNHEEDIILDVLSSIAPHVKSISLLPQTYEGIYPQMPEEGIDEKTFHTLKNSIKPINWAVLSNADSIGELYCTNDRCELR